MNPILHLFASPAWSNLVYALLHSLWLGILWSVLLSVALRLAGPKPHRRYLLSLTALAALLISIFAAWAFPTIDWSDRTTTPIEISETPIPTAHSQLSNTSPAPPPTSSPITPVQVTEPAPPPNWIPIASLAWLLGFAFTLTRLTAELLQVRRTSLECEPISDSALLCQLDELKHALGINRAVAFATSAAVKVPCVLGAFTPVILLPAAMVTGIPAEQMRAILAHELAHIRRHDFLINIFQQLIHTLLFFNPAVWWLNRQIRLEREACCDALAIAVLPGTAGYARALIDIAQSTHPYAPLLQPAFPGDRQPSTLFERVQRLLTPGYQPLVRLPWPSFLLVMLLSTSLLAAIWQGSWFALAFAAEILTPEQRIQKIAELESTQIKDDDRTYTAADKITLSGQIRTADGHTLDRWPHIMIKSSRPSHTFGSGAHPDKSGHFETKLEYGKIHLGVVQPGYAPIFVGPLTTTPGGSITNVDLVLTNGFNSTIQVVDPSQKPIPGVHLEGRYDHPVGWIPLQVETDEKGQVLLTNLASVPMNWTATAPGYEINSRKSLAFQPNETLTWTLQPALRTSGKVIDRTTKQPIAEAQIKLVARGPNQQTFIQFESAPILATTDANGTFNLDSLPQGSKHVLVIEAPAHAPKLIYNVLAGQDLVPTELGPEIFVQGEIHGDLSLLQASPDPIIYYSQPIKIGENTHSHSAYVPVRVENGIGYFTVKNLREGELQVTAGNHQTNLDLSNSITNLVIQFTPPADPSTPATRPVLIQFTPPRNAPPVRGVLNLRNWTATDGITENQAIAITNNQARLNAKVPGWISYETTGLIGYWIPEQHALQIESGTNEFVIKVEPLPAGAIHGSVRNPDKSETGGVLLSVIEARQAPDKEYPQRLGEIGKRSSSPNDGPTRYVAQPLPLDGEYVIVAHKDERYVASEPIALTAGNPIREVNLRLVHGQNLSGRVLDPSGKPLVGIKTKLMLTTTYGHSFMITSGLLSDASGAFTFPNLNPDFPGTYKLIIDDEPGWQPLSIEADFDAQPITLTLKPGLQFTATVIHPDTGNPLSGAQFFANPVDAQPGEPFAYMDADAKTDADGTLKFSRLSDREYWIGSRSGTIPNAANGRLRITPGQQPLSTTIHLIPYPGAQVTESPKK